MKESPGVFLRRLLSAWKSHEKDDAARATGWYWIAVALLLPVGVGVFTGIHFLSRWLWSPALSLFLTLSALPLSCLLVVVSAQAADRKFRLRERLGWTGWNLDNLKKALLLLLVMLPVIWGVNALSLGVFEFFGWPVRNPVLQQMFQRGSWMSVGMVAFTAIILAPVTEEVIFRRIIFTAISSKAGNLAGIAVTSLLFALVHDCSAQMPALFLLGVAMQLLYLERKGLAAPIMMHGCNNALAVGLMILGRLYHWDWVFEL